MSHLSGNPIADQAQKHAQRVVVYKFLAAMFKMVSILCYPCYCKGDCKGRASRDLTTSLRGLGARSYLLFLFRMLAVSIILRRPTQAPLFALQKRRTACHPNRKHIVPLRCYK